MDELEKLAAMARPKDYSILGGEPPKNDDNKVKPLLRPGVEEEKGGK